MNETQTGSGWRVQARLISWSEGILPKSGDKAGALHHRSWPWSFAAVCRQLATLSCSQLCPALGGS